MSNTSCHLGRCRTSSGRWQAARRAAITSSSQDSGTNSRQSSGQEACSVTALTDTPSWQLARLPSVPQYWRCTPTEPGVHRLDRLAAAVQQQPAQVALAAATLIPTGQRLEDVGGEPLQAVTDGGQLGRCDAPHGVSLARTGRTAPYTLPSTADLTESY